MFVQSVSVCGQESPTERGSSAVSSCQHPGLPVSLLLLRFTPTFSFFFTLVPLSAPPPAAEQEQRWRGFFSERACCSVIRKHGSTPPHTPTHSEKHIQCYVYFRLNLLDQQVGGKITGSFKDTKSKRRSQFQFKNPPK